MKLLKTLGKLLSIPFLLLKILILACMLPITAIEKCLTGKVKEFVEQFKFALRSTKAMLKALWSDRTYASMFTKTFINDSKVETFNTRFSIENGNIEEKTTLNIYECEQKSEECD